MREVLRQGEVIDAAAFFEQRQQPPAGVELSGFQTEFGGFGKGVMIVMPSFSHCQQAQPDEVMSLHRRTLNLPRDFAKIVCEKIHQPMTEE